MKRKNYGVCEKLWAQENEILYNTVVTTLNTFKVDIYTYLCCLSEKITKHMAHSFWYFSRDEVVRTIILSFYFFILFSLVRSVVNLKMPFFGFL